MTLKLALEILTAIELQAKDAKIYGLRNVKEAIKTVRNRRKVWQSFRELADRVEHVIET